MEGDIRAAMVVGKLWEVEGGGWMIFNGTHGGGETFVGKVRGHSGIEVHGGVYGGGVSRPWPRRRQPKDG